MILSRGQEPGYVADTPLLKAKIGRGQIQVDVGGFGNRRHVAWAVPAGPDAAGLRKGGHTPGRRDPADIGNMGPDKVNAVLRHRCPPFVVIDIQLAQGKGRCAVIVNLPQPSHLFRRDHIFDKE